MRGRSNFNLMAAPERRRLFAILGGIDVSIDSRSGYSRLISEGSLWWVRFNGWRVAEVARPWPTNAATLPLDAGSDNGHGIARDEFKLAFR